MKRGELYKILSDYTERSEEFRLSLTSNYGGDPISLPVLAEFWEYLNEDIPFKDDRNDKSQETEEVISEFVNGTQGILNVYRQTAIMTSRVIPGDQVTLLEDFTATCMQVSKEGKLFLFDQTIADLQMNEEDTNGGGYEESQLRKKLQTLVTDLIPPEICMQLKDFKNGDKFRIPYAGEIFDPEVLKNDSRIIPDNRSQWRPMQDLHHRIAVDHVDGLTDYYWLANTVKESSTNFCLVYSSGNVAAWGASNSLGVRPAFLIA